MNKVVVKSLEETSIVAKRILNSIEMVDDFASTIFLIGDLGAGKTTFTKTLAKHMGVKDTVISPTFILQKKYQTKHKIFKTLVHIDAYRFNDPSEAKVLDLEETMRNPNTLIVIEWPEKLGKKIRATKKVTFKTINEGTKQISW